MGNQTLRIRDSETWNVDAEKTIKWLDFSPGSTKLTRLDGFGDLYNQYKIHSVSIAWISEAATTNDGVVTFAISTGYSSVFKDKIKTADDLRKFRPFKSIPVWKSDSITVGSKIMQQEWMYCDDESTRDGPCFCLGAIVTKKNGYFKITYDVTLRNPHPT